MLREELLVEPIYIEKTRGNANSKLRYRNEVFIRVVVQFAMPGEDSAVDVFVGQFKESVPARVLMFHCSED